MRAVLCLAGLAASTTVMITGATGRSGSLVYEALKKDDPSLSLRAFVRNATKAGKVLGCSKCDESEGIFVGDLNKPETLTAGMKGADVLVITTGPIVLPGSCKLGPLGCKYAKDATPKITQYDGVKSSVTAFANAGGKRVILMSTMETSSPDNFLDKLGGGHATFYALNGEAWVMASGLEFTIVKACGLSDVPAGHNKLIVGHDDVGFSLMEDHSVARADVAAVMAAAVTAPEAKNLRFDFCSEKFGKVDKNAEDVLKAAQLPWEKKAETTLMI